MPENKYTGKFTILTISKSTRANKAWRARGTYKGAKIDIHGGQPGKENIWGVEPNKTRYFQRHGSPKTLIQFINALNWKLGSRIGQKVKVPEFLIENHLKNLRK